MFGYLKKIWPIIIIVLFVAVYGLLFGVEYDLIANGAVSANNDFIFIPAIIIALVFTGCWIWFMVHAIKNKELKNNALWLLNLYLFNVFIMPYYYYKHMLKVDDVLEKMISMLIIYVISFSFGLVLYSLI